MIKSKPKSVILNTAVAVLGIIAVIASTPKASASLDGTIPFQPFTPDPIGTPEIPGVAPAPLPNLNPGPGPNQIPAGSQVMLAGLPNLSGSSFIYLSPTADSNTSRFKLTVTEIVYRETATGNLDFIFQVTNSPGTVGSDTIKRITLVNWGTFKSLVGFDVESGPVPVLPATHPLSGVSSLAAPFNTFGTTAPFSADRVTAATVGFDFPDPIGSIAPSTSTKWFVIATDAKTFTTGFLGAIDGGVASVQIYVPAAIPEPSTYLFGAALGAVMVTAYLRRRKEQPCGLV